MTKPTEAEVAAATNAAFEELKRQQPDTRDLSTDHDKPKFSVVLAFDAFDLNALISAALTAAAQVRERADIEALQRATSHDQPMICYWCNKMHRGGPENCGKPEAVPAQTQAAPDLMPIYGATEAPEDQGPDVLGLRKGED